MIQRLAWDVSLAVFSLNILQFKCSRNDVSAHAHVSGAVAVLPCCLAVCLDYLIMDILAVM